MSVRLIRRPCHGRARLGILRQAWNTSFVIVDKIMPISDPLVSSSLDQKAIASIKTGDDSFELSMPGSINDFVASYGFVGPGLKGRFPDLMLDHYRNALGENLDNLDIDAISKRHGIIAEFDGDPPAQTRFSIKRALVGSISKNGVLYAANEGNWYRLDQVFKSTVDENFMGLVEQWVQPPEVIVKRIEKEKGKPAKVKFESELDYNRRCATSYGQVCLDQDLISVPEVAYGSFEACDLLDISGKRLIHVKKSSRQSSVLSHFFKQGGNSARILKRPISRRVSDSRKRWKR